MRGLRSRVPVPPVAHLPFGHDAAVRRGESHAFRVELLSDPKGGWLFPATSWEGLTKYSLCRRAALLAPWQRPQSRPYLWIWTLPASSPGNEHRTPATSGIPPNPPTAARGRPPPRSALPACRRRRARGGGAAVAAADP